MNFGIIGLKINNKDPQDRTFLTIVSHANEYILMCIYFFYILYYYIFKYKKLWKIIIFWKCEYVRAA